MTGYKTMAFFGLILLIGIANLFGFGSFTLPPELQDWVVPVISLVGLILRAVTKTEVFKKK